MEEAAGLVKLYSSLEVEIFLAASVGEVSSGGVVRLTVTSMAQDENDKE